MSERSETEIKSMTKEQNYFAGYADCKTDMMSIIEDIKSEIAWHKDDKLIHAEVNEMIDIVLEIIDRHISGKESE